MTFESTICHFDSSSGERFVDFWSDIFLKCHKESHTISFQNVNRKVIWVDFYPNKNKCNRINQNLLNLNGSGQKPSTVLKQLKKVCSKRLTESPFDVRCGPNSGRHINDISSICVSQQKWAMRLKWPKKRLLTVNVLWLGYKVRAKHEHWTFCRKKMVNWLISSQPPSEFLLESSIIKFVALNHLHLAFFFHFHKFSRVTPNETKKKSQYFEQFIFCVGAFLKI